MAMTDDQQAQTERLHGALSWVYPGVNDVAQPPAPQVLPPAPGGGMAPQSGGGGFSPAGAGTGLYNSSLIQALRQASPPFTSSNPGVTMMPNQAAPSAPVKRSPAPTGLTFNPPVFTMPEAPAEDIFTETDVKGLLSNAYDEWAAKNVPQQPAYSFNDGP